MEVEHSSTQTKLSGQPKNVAKDIRGVDKISLKKELAEIAGIPFMEGWSVFDSNEDAGLYLLHSDIEPRRSGLPRGTVVDLKNRTVVCSSFGFTPTAPSSCLSVIPETHDLAVIDEYLNQHIFKQNNYSITPAYEGVIVRVFKHAGTVYFSTHKKLDCSRSRWGRSEFFLDIYKRLRGPSAETLFPEDVLYSPWCYVFLLVDNALLVATKQDIGMGYIVDLGPQKMWSYDSGCPFSLDEDADDSSPFVGAKHTSAALLPALESQLHFVGGDKPFMVRPCHLNLKDANQFLKSGYPDEKSGIYPDKGTAFWGESVILYQYDGDGRVCDSVRVQSEGYHWRTKMRGDNPNIRHRFYQLLNDALKPEQLPQLLTKYPFFYRRGRADKNFESIWVVHCGQHIQLDMRKTDDRIFLVYVTFFESLPPSQKLDGLKLWDEFKNDRDDVIVWIQDLASGEIEPPETEEGESLLSHRLQEILRLTKDHAKNRKRQGRDKNRYGKRMSEAFLVKANIRNLILRESGPSLFRLIREMRRAEKTILLKEK